MKNSVLRGKVGMMVHYLPPFPINDEYKTFDTAGFLSQFDKMNFDYLLFTLGQNSGWYNAPNKVLDRYAGKGHCSEYDLFGELAQAMDDRGKGISALRNRGQYNLTRSTGLDNRTGYSTGNISGALLQGDRLLGQALWQSA